uniref:Atad5b n=1 Tax=Haplophryne mollis TaxID=412653 RepID=A0AA49GKL5_HAPMO|nr:Atad5b [Haplophryne mollis]
MRNKLKRSKKSANASCPSRDHPRTNELTTAMSSGSRSSTGETDRVKHGSDVAAAGFPATDLLGQRETSVSGGIKIAPIFFQQNKSQRSSGWRSGQPAEKRSAQRVKGEERLSTVSHLTERKSSRPGPLPPSALHSCLQEIRTSNPAFPVRAVFRTLQGKTCPQHSDSSFDDVLWTDKYSPQHSSEVVGNSASVIKLQSWLKKWKLRAVKDERSKVEERKQEENSKDSWDCGDFQGEAGEEEDREEPLCNAMLITGPPGVGKTASVYACSQELGFKVFEVNCSSLRSGCHVLSQLREATQSHLVQTSGKDPLKPAYFNNYSSASKSETGKTAPVKNVTSSKKRVPQNFGRSGRKGKAHPATVTLPSYFKTRARADHSLLGVPSPSVKPGSKTSGSCSPGAGQTAAQNKQTATSLILFEEVDVIFEDDVGFLTAIKTFMTSTKRPVVLTTNDPSFRERFNCSLGEIVFATPSLVNVCSYLRLVGLAENVRLERDDVINLLRVCGGDVRRCLLQLQLWVHGGGGRASCAQDSSVTERGDDAETRLPQYETGCTANMLGLHPVTQNHLPHPLKASMAIFKIFWSETDTTKLLRLSAESWRRRVPLLYSNLELLLGTSASSSEKGTCSGPQSDLPSPNVHIQRLDGSVDPKASATGSKSVISRLSRRKYIKFDATSSSTLTQTPPRTLLLLAGAHSRSTSSRDKTEQQAAKVASDRLAALTDFLDLMSYLDSTMPSAAALVSGSCRPGAFVWTGAEIKDGLLDEMREEDDDDRSLSEERLLDIQAGLEGLGCRRCLSRMSAAWTEAQNDQVQEEPGDASLRRLMMETRTLPASSGEQSLSFSLRPLCSPSVSRRRYKLSRKVLGSDSFGLLGNRNAVSVDYMPVLRRICRSQREQRQEEEPVRCLNYLSNKNLGLSKSTIQLLAEDFL